MTERPTTFIRQSSFSALQRAEIAEIAPRQRVDRRAIGFSALQRAEIAEMPMCGSELFQLKLRFSALQRAEIAEMLSHSPLALSVPNGFSALQRAEIAEMGYPTLVQDYASSFSALQRAEIAEIEPSSLVVCVELQVSVLFNEPKLLKWRSVSPARPRRAAVSVLFNEPKLLKLILVHVYDRADVPFQCSSTSRNC